MHQRTTTTTTPTDKIRRTANAVSSQILMESRPSRKDVSVGSSSPTPFPSSPARMSLPSFICICVSHPPTTVTFIFSYRFLIKLFLFPPCMLRCEILIFTLVLSCSLLLPSPSLPSPSLPPPFAVTPFPSVSFLLSVFLLVAVVLPLTSTNHFYNDRKRDVFLYIAQNPSLKIVTVGRHAHL